jgi:hypothetical protein
LFVERKSRDLDRDTFRDTFLTIAYCTRNRNAARRQVDATPRGSALELLLTCFDVVARRL